MALKIRLRQQGRSHKPFYRLVVMQSRNKRDGRYVENLGWYNPLGEKEEENLALNEARILHWVEQGAVLSEKAEALIKRAAPSVVARRQEREAIRLKKRADQRKKKTV